MICYNERNRRDELFGFGKKKKTDTNLTWDKASNIVKAALDDMAKKHRNVDWSNRGKSEISKSSKYVVLNSLTGAYIQYMNGGDVVVASPDVEREMFECPIENGKVKGLDKVFNYFDKVDMKQGKINSNKYRKESFVKKNHNNIRSLKERFIGMDADEEIGYKLDDICRKYAELGFDSVSDMCSVLKDIERSSSKLGCAMYLQPVDGDSRYAKKDVNDFCKYAESYEDDDSFFDITFVESEPGDNYMITINDFDGNFEGFADFIFVPFEDEEDDDMDESFYHSHNMRYGIKHKR